MRRLRKKTLIMKCIAHFLILVTVFTGISECGGDLLKVHAATPASDTDILQTVSLGEALCGAIQEDGSLWMWGGNYFGQVGDGTNTSKSRPVQITSIGKVESVAVGGLHSAAVTEDGKLYTWGCNNYGALGDGTTEHRSSPVQVLTGVKSAAASAGSSNWSAAIKENGTLWMWGNNNYGQLGKGEDYDDELTPAQVSGISNVKQVCLGYDFTLALTKDGKVYGWGNNDKGQTGTGSTAYTVNTPTLVMADVKCITASVGGYSAAAVKNDGTLWVWGQNDTGLLQLGNVENQFRPVQLTAFDHVKKVAFGESHFAVLKEDGSLWMWGLNFQGQLSDAVTVGISIPPTEIMTGIKDVFLGMNCTAVVKEDNSLWMFGNGYGYEIGNGNHTKINSVPYNTLNNIKTFFGSLPAEPFKMDIDTTTLIDADTYVLNVVNMQNEPVKGATVQYDGGSYTTDTNGKVNLGDPVSGKKMQVSAAGYQKKSGTFKRRVTRQETICLVKSGYQPSEVIMALNGKETNLLKKEKTINTFYFSTKFDLICKEGNASSMIGRYELYSGDTLVMSSADGSFVDLKYSQFEKNKTVSIQTFDTNNVLQNITALKLKVIEENSTPSSLSLGNGFKVAAGKDIPVIGGTSFNLQLESLPVTVNADENKWQIGLNVTDLAKKDKDWFKTIKGMNKKTAAQFMSAMKNISKDNHAVKGAGKIDCNVIGYLEGPLNSDNYITGKLYIEVSASAYQEKQINVYGVPCVVEVTVSGKVHADGSITFSSQEGISGEINVGIGVGAGLYLGVGIANFASAGIYGKASIELDYRLLPRDLSGITSFYVEGEVGVKAKLFGKDVASISLIDGKYYIINNDKSRDSTVAAVPFYVDNNTVYPELSRNYLSSMEEWNGTSDVLQDSIYLDVHPQIVSCGNTHMLFYITDAGTGRNDADRSMLVYSLYNEMDGSFSEPKAVNDDGTADFTPDFYSDGTDIYAVWQDAKTLLSSTMTLNELTGNLDLEVARYNKETGNFDILGTISGNESMLEQQPQITVENGKPAVFWYENQEDNVLGRTGISTIYKAIWNENTAVVSTNTSMTVSENEVLEEESSQTEPEEITISGNETNYTGETSEAAGTLSGNDAVSDNDIPEDTETVSGNDTVSGNETVSDNTTESIRDSKEAFTNLFATNWTISELCTEDNRILSQDAGNTNGSSVYAYASGTLDEQDSVVESKIFELTSDNGKQKIGEGTPEKIGYEVLFGQNVLTWYEAGDICYKMTEGKVESLFGESRLPGVEYEILQDVSGNPSVLYPVNIGGSSNLYRIPYNVTTGFGASIAVTNQEQYIQYMDGFQKDNEFILVYNRMQADEETGEEISNSLCTEKIAQTGYDIQMISADSMIQWKDENDKDTLQLFATLFNNGTETIQNINLQLKKDDGSLLESKPVTLNLAAGEETTVMVEFALAGITQKADYVITAQIDGQTDLTEDDNSTTLTMGASELSLETDLLSIGDTQTLQLSIRNRGIEESAGILTIHDHEDGTEYLKQSFDAITAGKSVLYEIPIERTAFDTKDVLNLDIEVVPVIEQDTTDILSDIVSINPPEYTLTFVEDTEAPKQFVMGISYNKAAQFPENPTKEDARFGGWNSEEDGSGDYYTEETPIKESMTLYAVWLTEDSIVALDNCTVSEIADQSYTGKEIKPALSVKYIGETLNAKTDYTVSYRNNKAQGTATAIITGKGKYTGSIEKDFSIRYPISKAAIGKIAAIAYDGETKTPALNVTYNKSSLEEETDYTVMYSGNKDAGTACATITGVGDYMGTKTVNFTITGIDISKMVYPKLSKQIYTGEEIEPDVIIKDKKGNLLSEGTDYQLIFYNNVNKGTAAIHVIGKGSYSGSKKLTFSVTAASVNTLTVEPVTTKIYDGKAYKPSVIVKNGESTLTAGKDYTLSYKNNTKAGTATITINGKGNYTGSRKVSASIERAVLDDNNTQVIAADMAYTKRAVKSAVSVYYNGVKLKSSDYSVSYSDNIERGNGTATITGKGNYTGTVTQTFRITDKAKLLSSLKYGKLVNKVYTGMAIEQPIVIKDGAYTLLEGVDYVTAYSNQTNVGTAKATVTGIGQYAGSKTLTYKITAKPMAARYSLLAGYTLEEVEDVLYTGNIEKPKVVLKDNGAVLVEGRDYKLSYSNNSKLSTAKKKATITIKGIGNYSGSSKTSFNIVSWNYDDLTAVIEDQIYTGSKLTPKVKFMYQDEEILLKKTTTYTVSYKDNINTGKATAVIKGAGSLKSMQPKTITFMIHKADLSNAVLGKIADQTYKGMPLTPVPTVKAGKRTLKKEKDFTVSYMNNKTKGEATITVIGTGNYTGNASKTFIIK